MRKIIRVFTATSFLIVLTVLLFFSCKLQTTSDTYCIEFSPMGISDIPRDTVYISTNNSYCEKHNWVSDRFILTDTSSLYCLVEFTKKNYQYAFNKSKDYDAYGCYKIMIYNNGSLITSSFLDHVESAKYFGDLLKRLNDGGYDRHLLPIIRENQQEGIY